MMRILSAEFMASIPKASIKRFVKHHFGANITDDGADEIVKILEEKAEEISKHAVENAKRDSRDKVTRKDVMRYVVGDEDE